MHLARPRKHSRQQRLNQFPFILRVFIRRIIPVVRLIPNIPPQNPLVIGKRTHHALHIGLQPRILPFIFQRTGPRALYPTRIVYARRGRMLFAQFRIWIPTRIEQHKQRLDMVLVRNGQKRTHAFLKPRAVLLPKQIMQEHAHRRHAQTLRPTQLQVDPLWVERIRLPHLQFVNGVGRQIVAADRPRLLRIPGIGLLSGPARWLRRYNGIMSTAKITNFLITFVVSNLIKISAKPCACV